MSVFKMIANLSMLFYLLICFYYNSVDSVLDLRAVNEEYIRHIFPPSGEARNLIEESLICHNRRYWATACKQVFRKIREMDDDYRYSLYVNYPRFPYKEDGSKCEHHTLWFFDMPYSTEEPLQYTETEGLEQMMIPCFNTEASVPLDTEESHAVPDYIEFWIYPGSSSTTTWMLIKYYPDLRKFFLIYWFNDIRITDYDLVPSDIFSLPIPTSITDKNMLVEKLTAANEHWMKWEQHTHLHAKRGIQQILTIISNDDLVTLCTTLIGEYLHKTKEHFYQDLKVIQFKRKQYTNLIVHIEQQTDETCENDEGQSSVIMKKAHKVYLTQSNRKPWRQIGVIKGYICPVMSSPFDFYVAWGTDENSVLLIRFFFDKKNDGQHVKEIVKMIENINTLHLRHLYFNGFYV